MDTPNAKPALGAVGLAAAGITWPMLALFNAKIGSLSPEALSALTTNTGAVFGGILYYLVPPRGWGRTRTK